MSRREILKGLVIWNFFICEQHKIELFFQNSILRLYFRRWPFAITTVQVGVLDRNLLSQSVSFLNSSEIIYEAPIDATMVFSVYALQPTY